jgi:hypothetical protein
MALPPGSPRDWPRRHPAEVTTDRLTEHVTAWADKFSGQERDDISYIIQALIAEGTR